MSDIYKGIVLKSIPYKESDAIVTILNKENGFIVFKARGVFKINSKNASSLQLYTIGEYKVESKTDYSNKVLTSSMCDFFPLYVYEDLKYTSLLSFVNEVIHLFKDEYSESYDLLELLIKNLKKIDFLTAVLMVIKYIIKWSGVSFEVDSCVECNNKKVNSFNYDAGGFLCGKCSTKHIHNIDNLDYLKTMRIVMKAKMDNIFLYEVDPLIGVKVLLDLFKYLENRLGIYFKSKEMLMMCIKVH